ncbi:MAG: hemolysin family protein [Candidatus Eiseniibacteriota bacterium]
MITATLIALGLLFSAFFSAVETALVSANRTRLSHLADAGNGQARQALRLLEDPRRLLGATLVGNTLANVFTATLATLHFEHRYGEDVVIWVVIALTAVLLVVGEVVPKTVARAQADQLTLKLALPLESIYAALRPLVLVINGASAVLLRALGVNASPARAVLSRQEFQLLLDESEETGQVAPAQGRILSRVMDFGETTVTQVMRPRGDIVAVETGTSVQDVAALVHDRGFTRIPVYRDDLDQIVGMVHLFDLFRAPHQHLPVDGLLRPIDFVPEAKRCDDLLREMRTRRRALAIVVDEYGGTAGIVTIEDLVEELVGDIRNEEEAQTAPVRRLDAQRWAVDARTHIADVSEAIEVDLPEGDYETIAGLLLDRLGKIPHAGESLTLPGVRLDVTAADTRRVRTVTVTRLARPKGRPRP